MARPTKQRKRKAVPPKTVKKSRVAEALTLGEYLTFLTSGPVSATDPPNWPPDLFAVSTAVLQKSGAYHHVIGDWPPQLVRALTASESRLAWAARMRTLGLEWRSSLKNGGTALPPQVKQWWRTICAGRAQTLQDIGTAADLQLCAALVQIAAVADEACVGFGLPGGEFDPDFKNPRDDAFRRSQELLLFERDPLRGSTLCQRIHHSRVRVLPKLHTPRTGLTIRSLSQYLSLCPSSEIIPNWCRTPVKHQNDLNLLLVPWPDAIHPPQFSAFKTNLPGRYGLFAYTPERIPDIANKLPDLLDRAKRRLSDVPGISPRLDGAVFPELALTPEDFAIASEAVKGRATFLVSGVAKPPTQPNQAGYNSVHVSIWQSSGELYSLKPQNKHHRWQLETSQINNYGLSAQLQPDHRWWEATALDSRTINFVPLFDWLTFSVLICEDLARPEPVGDLLRAVGPNLVIALLMDGPQQDWRWSARYSTALADDPGSSVLTLTSAGMVRRYAGASSSGALEIGCWKDTRQGRVQPILLPPKAEAVVLHIEMEKEEEWTADGRGDKETACYPVLKRAVPIGGGAEVTYPILR